MRLITLNEDQCDMLEVVIHGRGHLSCPNKNIRGGKERSKKWDGGNREPLRSVPADGAKLPFPSSA